MQQYKIISWFLLYLTWLIKKSDIISAWEVSLNLFINSTMWFLYIYFWFCSLVVGVYHLILIFELVFYFIIVIISINVSIIICIISICHLVVFREGIICVTLDTRHIHNRPIWPKIKIIREFDSFILILQTLINLIVA